MEKSNDDIMIQSYWTAALISYARCFASGKRYRLTEDIFKGLKGDPIGCHKYYKNLRDKHIAHSVNPFEQVHVGLVLSEPDNPKREVLGVSTLSQKLICSDVDGVNQLIALASIILKEVARQAKEYESKTFEAGENIPIDTLYSKAIIKTITPGPEDAGKPR